jgi:hypothetical protein
MLPWKPRVCGDPGVESRMAHATGVEIHRARSDRGMSLFGTQPHTLKARLWSVNLDGPVFSWADQSA